MQIGKLKINNNVFLAPIAGYTDMPFRHICKMAGAGLTYTEMVSAKGLFFNNQNSEKLLLTSELENIKAVQIFGSDAGIMAKICAEKLDGFDIIDINMGCPTNKIVKNNEGSYLLKDISLASKIIESCAKATNKIVTVKFRRGFENEDISSDFGKMCEDSGAQMITLHGRFSKQFYSGTADYNCVEKLVKAVKIPVVANGDIESKEKANEVFANTGCAAIMIARAAIGNPDIFAEILGTEKLDKKMLFTIQLDLMSKFYGEKYALTNIRKFIPHYLKGYKNAKTLKEELINSKSLEELKNSITKIFKLGA